MGGVTFSGVETKLPQKDTRQSNRRDSPRRDGDHLGYGGGRAIRSHCKKRNEKMMMMIKKEKKKKKTRT